MLIVYVWLGSVHCNAKLTVCVHPLVLNVCPCTDSWQDMHSKGHHPLGNNTQQSFINLIPLKLLQKVGQWMVTGLILLLEYLQYNYYNYSHIIMFRAIMYCWEYFTECVLPCQPQKNHHVLGNSIFDSKNSFHVSNITTCVILTLMFCMLLCSLTFKPLHYRAYNMAPELTSLSSVKQPATKVR